MTAHGSGTADDAVSGAAARETASESPPVTVVVVSYFSADSLEGCLDSVVSQSGVDARVVVVDNGAPEARADGRLDDDESTETASLCRAYDAVEYVESDDNVGFPAAVERGFALVDAEYLATLNPDAAFADGALDRLVDRLEPAGADRSSTETAGSTADSTPAGDRPRDGAGAAFAAPKIVLADRPDRISTCGLVTHYTGISFNRAADLSADHPAWSRERDLGSLSGCAFATTAAAWDRVGGFDEEFFLYKDDVSLSWACRLAGERIRFVPDAVVRHDYSRDLDGFKLYHVERNRLLLLAKYLPLSAAVLLAPALLLADLLAWALAASLGIDGLSAKLRSYGVLLDPDARRIRRRGRPLRQRFPDAVDGLDAAVPWWSLRRSGVVPDSSLVGAAGAAVNALFRANLALYRSLVRARD